MLRSWISDYKIPKVVIVRSYPLTLICRCIQFVILFYGIGYLMYKKGYQIKDESIISSVIFRVKGINYNTIKQNQRIIVDDADYIVPSQEKDALFVMTNSIETDQKYSRCPEPLYNKESICVNDTQCQLNQPFQRGNGKLTGRCLLNIGRCELEGWCPVIDDYNMPTPSQDSLNFNIHF